MAFDNLLQSLGVAAMAETAAVPFPALLGTADPPAVEHWNPHGAAPALIVCDHASRRVPRALGTLGLDEAQLAQHIGWDIGAAAVTRALALRLDAPAILAGYSRLVIDCNRDPEDPTSSAAVSDGTAIPGNTDLGLPARAARRAQIFTPYHAAIAARLGAWRRQGQVPVLLSIHSFTPMMNGKARPWHVGVLWDEDPRVPVPLLGSLRAMTELCVGDNEPYSAAEPAGYTVRHHASRAGLPHVALEIRQDLIAATNGAEEWAGRLDLALAPILARDDIYRLLPMDQGGLRDGRQNAG